MAVRKIEHVGIMVSSLEQSIPFYENIVGLKHTETLLHTNGVIRLAFLSFESSSETEVELIEGYTGELAKAGRVHHVAFAVDDIEAEYERVRPYNLAGLDEAITTLPNGSRYFFFDGPDGEAIEFFQTTRGGTK
ncbi:VOC family protein [Cohnella cholangitidis]|uniref:VOC family protein n=1 Tax=Cohnella cholangitidis TaxID=2598458 RepID=A0A7G5C2H3_9BACL|nr:VOC family protein [Cohnella cholangitidis]QMV43407.1 VOC family protein [Cohnella cholangitidis]